MMLKRVVASCACLYYSFFLILLINHTNKTFAENYCRRSCGKLNKIPYPFWFSGDSPECGSEDFELVCDGGNDEDAKAVFYLDGVHKHFVTDIINYKSGGEIKINVECPFSIATGTCRLQHSSSFHRIPNFMNYTASFPYNINAWATFMNCSQPIQHGVHEYMMVPSLTNGNTSVYVIIDHFADELNYLHESCRFVDTFPFPFDFIDKVNSSVQVLEILREGFPLYWRWDYGSGCRYDLSEDNGDAYPVFLDIYPIYIGFIFFNCHGVRACGKNDYCVNIVHNITFYSQFALMIIVALSVFCRFVLMPLSICVFLVYNHRKNTKPIDNVENFLRNQQALSPRRYTYGDITVITRNFRDKLGKGGFGQVYKGELLGGFLVAVKVLNGVKDNGEDFINEVATIGRIHHVNIVQLLGFCSEGTKRALIYEYMPNGSLDKYIFSSKASNSCCLNSDKLHTIALGIARGINYLHSGCDMQILHFDIKPHNILLDHNFTPKISDFGLAKLYPKEQNLVSMSVARGTIGYIAPELVSRSFGIISYKSDVYSFGMLLLEMAGRRRNVNTTMQRSSEIYFPSWIYDKLAHLEKQNFSEIHEIHEIGEIERKLCKVGLWCIQVNSANRPTMAQVVEFLEADEDALQMPPKPFFSTIDGTSEKVSIIPSTSKELSSIIEDVDTYVDLI